MSEKTSRLRAELQAAAQPARRRQGMKELAIELLYGEGADVVNRASDAALLLLLYESGDKFSVRNDPVAHQHLVQALARGGAFSALSEAYERGLPGDKGMADWYYGFALSLVSAGRYRRALTILRMVLQLEDLPNPASFLLLAARVSSRSPETLPEAAKYAEAALVKAKGSEAYLKGKCLEVYGVIMGAQAATAVSDAARERNVQQALDALQKAAAMEPSDPQIQYHLALQYADARRIGHAVSAARKAIALSGGAHGSAWLLLALCLSAREKFSDAIAAAEAAAAEAADDARLVDALRVKAAVLSADGKPAQALRTYQQVLSILQPPPAEDVSRSGATEAFWFADGGLRVNARELESAVCQAIAALYTSLQQTADAEVFVERALTLTPHSAGAHHAQGALEEARSHKQEAIQSYSAALSMQPGFGPSALRLGVLYYDSGVDGLPLARCFLTDALRADPNSYEAWYHMGLVHKAEGSAVQAAECFRAAFALKGTAPAMSFRCLPRDL
eukprot:jgi/Chlat1/2712/Chrsp180S02884